MIDSDESNDSSETVKIKFNQAPSDRRVSSRFETTDDVIYRINVAAISATSN